MKLHHIGIVVPQIQNSINDINQYINFEQIGIIEEIISQKVNICFLKMGEFNLELIEPIGINSPVYNFTKQGGGIHHLCFEVKNIYDEIEQMKKKGATVIINPVKGFEGRTIAFLYLNMKNTRCNLIELAEEKTN